MGAVLPNSSGSGLPRDHPAFVSIPLLPALVVSPLAVRLLYAGVTPPV